MRPSAQEFRGGWRTLLAAALGVGLGTPALITTSGLFIVPMQAAFGWSRSALAIGPIIGLLYALLQPAGGVAIDRLGVRPTATIGILMLASGALALAAMPPSRPLFYAILIWLSIGATVAGNVVYCKAVSGWFTRNSGLAIALVLSGVSLVGAMLQPALAFVIAGQGWRIGYVTLAAVMLVVALPIVRLWLHERREEETVAKEPGVPLGGALRDPRFWLIVAAFGGAAFPIGGFVSQLQPLLHDKGYTIAAAAGVVASFLLLTTVGRLIAGLLFDHLPPSWVAGLFLMLAGVGAGIVASVDLAKAPALVATGAAGLIGLAQGAEGDFIALFTLRVFGRRRFSTLFALVVMLVAIAYALGGFFFTATYDRTGHYDFAVAASAGLFVLTGLIALAIRVPPAGTVED